jgi:RNA polymerase sigma-70 factor, ECF subfamily
MPRGGDGPAAHVGRLYDQFGASLYRYALMLLGDHAAAEDAIQQVFTRLLARPREIDKDEHYLRRAVRNECYSSLRTRTTTTNSPSLLEPVTPDARVEERMSLEAAIRELPIEQRELVHLHVFEGRTFQEIAELSAESMNTIASRYRYALEKLKQALNR